MNKVLGALALLSSTGAIAADNKPFELSAEFGLLNVSGNSESTSVKSKLAVKQELTSWRNSYLVEGLYKEDTVYSVVDGESVSEDQLSAKKYFASAQTDYKLDEKHKGLFIYGSYLYDRFSGYEYQGTIAVGYSDQLFKNDNSFLNYSVGPGMAFYKTDDGESDSSPILRVSAFYQYDISEGMKFTQEISSDVGTEKDSNTKTKSETAFSAQLNSSLALKLSYLVTHNSEVPLGIEKKDAQTAITLVYSH